MPFPTSEEDFIQSVGKPGTQQHIDWAWYHQPCPVYVLYHLSSEASDVPISGWCIKIQHTDPLQSQLRIFRHNLISCLRSINPHIISVTKDGKIVVFI